MADSRRYALKLCVSLPKAAGFEEERVLRWSLQGDELNLLKQQPPGLPDRLSRDVVAAIGDQSLHISQVWFFVGDVSNDANKVILYDMVASSVNQAALESFLSYVSQRAEDGVTAKVHLQMVTGDAISSGHGTGSVRADTSELGRSLPDGLLKGVQDHGGPVTFSTQRLAEILLLDGQQMLQRLPHGCGQRGTTETVSGTDLALFLVMHAKRELRDRLRIDELRQAHAHLTKLVRQQQQKCGHTEAKAREQAVAEAEAQVEAEAAARARGRSQPEAPDAAEARKGRRIPHRVRTLLWQLGWVRPAVKPSAASQPVAKLGGGAADERLSDVTLEQPLVRLVRLEGLLMQLDGLLADSRAHSSTAAGPTAKPGPPGPPGLPAASGQEAARSFHLAATRDGVVDGCVAALSSLARDLSRATPSAAPCGPPASAASRARVPALRSIDIRAVKDILRDAWGLAVAQALHQQMSELRHPDAGVAGADVQTASPPPKLRAGLQLSPFEQLPGCWCPERPRAAARFPRRPRGASKRFLRLVFGQQRENMNELKDAYRHLARRGVHAAAAMSADEPLEVDAMRALRALNLAPAMEERMKTGLKAQLGAEQEPLGIRWRVSGSAPPAAGQPLVHDGLSSSLAQSGARQEGDEVAIDEEVFEDFGLTDLRHDDFVGAVGGDRPLYFLPVRRAETEPEIEFGVLEILSERLQAHPTPAPACHMMPCPMCHVPCAMCPALCALCPSLCALRPSLCALCPAPCALRPSLCAALRVCPACAVSPPLPNRQLSESPSQIGNYSRAPPK